LVLHGDENPIVPVVNARLMAAHPAGRDAEQDPHAVQTLQFDEAERVGLGISRFFLAAELRDRHDHLE
jgi:hypothetical protein